MKIALIGTGKTGGKVLSLISPANLIGAFNTQTPPTLEKLNNAEVIISFVPGNTVNHLFPLLLKTTTPVVWGSTGYDWNDSLDQELKKRHRHWLYASNFSVGMTLVRKLLKTVAESSALIDHAHFQLNETHHTEKKDRPSGTALSWMKWLKKEIPINSFREGDVVGIHELKIKFPYEEITLKHEAFDRSVFAEGSLWAAKHFIKLIEQKKINPGLYSLDQIMDLFLMKES